MLETTITLLLFLFPLAYSPGPGNMFFAANGARFGFSATVPANAGYHVAAWVVAIGIGMGFGWIATAFPLFLVTIKYLGSAYVLYLAWSIGRAGSLQDDPNARHAGFWDGAILLLLNPKGYLIVALIFTQFVDATADSQILLIILVSTVATINNLIAFAVWAYIGDRLALVFRRETDARRLNMLFGVMLALVAVWMLLD